MRSEVLVPSPRRLATVVLAGWAVALSAHAGDAAPEAVDLVGTWYVLAHYRDSATANPDAYRWDDRVWVFEMKGSRLSWTEYPIVVFNDESGRFEMQAGGVRGRVLAAWEPSRGQMMQIRKGLEINPRGSKTKTLRGSSERGWESFGQQRAMSASSIGYSEKWRITRVLELPTFERLDTLGSVRAETIDGLTRWATSEIVGGELRGEFQRDESRRGSFRMMRAGRVKSVGSKRDRGQRHRDLLRAAEAESGE